MTFTPDTRTKHNPGWGHPSGAGTSRAALFRANTATFENIFRLPHHNSNSTSNSPIKKSDTFGSRVFQRALTSANISGQQNIDSLQRSCTTILNRHTFAKSIDLEENCEKTINGCNLEDVGPDAVRLFYSSDWSPAALHYSVDNGESWTQPPGTMMVEAVGANLPELAPSSQGLPENFRLWVLTIKSAPNGLEFVPNDNGVKWDNDRNGQNYKITRPGTFYLKDGQLKRLALPPGKPIILVEKSIGVQSIELSWNPPLDGEHDVAGYNIYRDDVKIGSLSMEEVLLLDKEEENTENAPVRCFGGFRNFVDSGLLGSTRYVYHVTAYNDNHDESALSAPLVIKTAEPDRPGQVDNFWVNRTSEDRIDLAWDTPMDTGGGIIQGYRIFRNGSPIAVVHASSHGVHRYLDTNVEPKEIYCYHVTAGLSLDALRSNVRLINKAGVEDSDEDEDIVITNKLEVPLPLNEMTSSNEGAKWIESIVKMIEDNKQDKEGPVSNYRFAEARNQAPLPKLFENRSHILLQSFNWHSCHNKTSWYKVLADRVPKMKEAGVSLLWLPPPSQSVAPQGYMPSKLYNLNSAYGSEELLRKLIRTCHDFEISPMVDFVANHRCGSKQDNLGQWTVFEEPEWGPWAIVANNKQGYRGVSNEQDSGAQSDCAPDINHNNDQVRNDYKAWLGWLFNDVGFRGIRIDMAPGYGVNHQLNYIHSVECPLTVGEYWSGDTNTLKNYIHKAQRKVAVYDFAFYYVLRRCVESGDYSEMNNCGNMNGLVGSEPGLAVTFLDNHDTEHLDFVGKFANGDARKVLIGYAILLTHPGIPSVYWNHFSDYGDYMTDQITKLGQLRQEAQICSTSKISIHTSQWDGYVAYITGSQKSDGSIKNLCLKVGHANNFHPSGGWQQRAHGDGWTVWLK